MISNGGDEKAFHRKQEVKQPLLVGTLSLSGIKINFMYNVNVILESKRDLSYQTF